MVLLSFILTLSSASLSAANLAANFKASASTLASLGCDTTCQQNFQEGQQKDVEKFGNDFDFQFYNTARNFSDSKPGDILKFQALNGSSLNSVNGLAAYRYQYVSRNLNGTAVPATGIIGVPYASVRQDKKYPLVAYAHSTSGVYAGCAPSSLSDLGGFDTLNILAMNGFAVVAPDYAGIGNNETEHEYMSFPAHANDLYYGMRAARHAFPDSFTDEWASVGHAQGGGAVWKLSETANVKSGRAGNYVGTVALAPMSKMHDMASYAAENVLNQNNYSSYDTTYEFLWLPIALQRAILSADTSSFSQKLLDRVQIAEQTQSCDMGVRALGIGLSQKDIIPNADAIKSNEDFQRWQELVSPAMGDNANKPILIVQGMEDTSVLPQISINAFNDTCEYGNEAYLSLYPGIKHRDVIAASAPEWLSFLQERFEGTKSTGGGCKQTVNTPFDASNMVINPRNYKVQDL